jgi:hypothetical protein
MTTTDDPVLPPHVTEVLRRTPVAKWNGLALLLDAESGSARIMTRGELAGWCGSNDLSSLASDAMSRKTAPGALLTLILRDTGPVWRTLFDPRTRKKK